MDNNTTTKVAQSDETVGTTLNVPMPIWKRLRNLSTETRKSQQALWLQAMSEFLDKKRKNTTV